jgi:anti-sigma B factor antagonist
MFDISKRGEGDVTVSGRFDAAQQDKARAVFDTLSGPTVVDLEDLDYISSAGLGILLKTHKRLITSSGGGLRLVNVNQHIREILHYSGLQQVFDVATCD